MAHMKMHVIFIWTEKVARVLVPLFLLPPSFIAWSFELVESRPPSSDATNTFREYL
jgi:hypothetical protein